MKEITIGEWADKWFEIYTVDLAKSTVSLYKDARRRLNCNFPEMENTPIDELLPMTFQNILNSLGTHYAQSTVRHIKVFYNRLYETAIENHLCEWNPITTTRIPKYASVKVVDAMSRKEQQAFENAAATLPETDYFALMTLLLTGLRRSELLTLKWQDWDKAGKTLYVQKSKTKNGLRTIPVIPEVAYMLAKLESSPLSRCCPYIFQFEGKQMPKHHLRYICDKTAKLAEIRHVSPHILRHSFATRMIEHGADPKSLSVIIGHSNVAFTLQRYVSADKSHLRDQMMLLSQQK